MRYYSCEKIKSFIEEHKDEIDEVSLGMIEDWSWTAETVYDNGEFGDKYDFGGKTLTIAGIKGSYWATPTMEVYYKDGRRDYIDCWLRGSDEEI